MEIRHMKRKWNIYWKASLICLSVLVILLITVWGGRQFYSNERTSYYNALWSELYRNKELDVTGIRSIVQQEIDRGHIKDTLITEGGGSAAPIIFTTLGNEGFPQYDNLLIQTEVEARAAVHPNYNKVYEIRYSYNTVRDSVVIVLGAGLFILSAFLFAIGAVKNKRG